MRIPKKGELFSHKDGEVYKVLGTQVLTNTFEVANNNITMGTAVSKHTKVKTTLVWYSPTYNDMEVYVRTLSHFFASFSDAKLINCERATNECF